MVEKTILLLVMMFTFFWVKDIISNARAARDDSRLYQFGYITQYKEKETGFPTPRHFFGVQALTAPFVAKQLMHKPRPPDY